MSKNELLELCDKLGYIFQKFSLLETALTHRSHSATNNERLEFLGDSILSFVMTHALYHRYPKATEGELSRLRSHLVREEALFEIAKNLNLGNFLKLGLGELKTGGANRASTLADAMEAIIAAIFLDSNLESAQACVLRLFKEKLDKTSLSFNIKDPKTKLQEYLQSKKQALPVYEVVSAEGDLHQQTFKISCQVKGYKKETFGISTNRRKAEQAAALAFLQYLKQE